MYQPRWSSRSDSRSRSFTPPVARALARPPTDRPKGDTVALAAWAAAAHRANPVSREPAAWLEVDQVASAVKEQAEHRAVARVVWVAKEKAARRAVDREAPGERVPVERSAAPVAPRLTVAARTPAPSVSLSATRSRRAPPDPPAALARRRPPRASRPRAPVHASALPRRIRRSAAFPSA